MSTDELALLTERVDPQHDGGHVGAPDRVGGPISLPEALEIETDFDDFCEPDDPD